MNNLNAYKVHVKVGLQQKLEFNVSSSVSSWSDCYYQLFGVLAESELRAHESRPNLNAQRLLPAAIRLLPFYHLLIKYEYSLYSI